MKLIQKITIKQMITEQSKEKIKSRFMERKHQLEQECQQLAFEKRKLQKKKGISPEDVNQRFQKEIDRRKSQLKWMEYQLEQLAILPIGNEITEDEMDALVEVNVGDNWEQMIKERAIVIKDGIVTRIE